MLFTATLTAFLVLACTASGTSSADTGTSELEPRDVKICKPGGTQTLGWCDRRNKQEVCHYIEEVAGKKGEAPCHKLDTGGTNQMGMWPSVDINCTIFANDACRYKIGTYEQATFPLNDWGFNNFGTKPWTDVGWKGNAKDKGPQSVFCWLRDNVVGLGDTSNKCDGKDSGCIIRPVEPLQASPSSK